MKANDFTIEPWERETMPSANESAQKDEPDHFRSELDASNSFAPIDAGEPKGPPLILKPTRFTPLTPAMVPPRGWLYGDHYLRKFCTGTIAPGGSAKSTNALNEALSMATGVPFLGPKPIHPLKVWYYNAEDPQEETQRRIMAAAMHHGLDMNVIAQNLFYDSGRDVPLKVATNNAKDGFTSVVPVVDALIKAILENKIDCLILDPFVSFHSVSENDNSQIDAVVKEFARIADITNCSIEHVHHTRKIGAQQVTGDDGRGGSSIQGAWRSQRVINKMTPEIAGMANIEESKRRSFFCIDDGKLNFREFANSQWRRIVGVDIGNGNELYPRGDNVATVEPFELPDLFDGVSLNDLRKAQSIVSAGDYGCANTAKDWAGHAIGVEIGIETSSKGGKKRMTLIIKKWVENGMFEEERVIDKNGRQRPMLRVAKLADSTS